MSTPEPSQNSQNDQSSTSEYDSEVKRLIVKLKDENIEAEQLAVAIIGGNEMIFGEVCRPGEIIPVTALSGGIFLRDPKRLSRVPVQNRQGQISYEIRFGNFDFMNKGFVETKPQAFFYIDWCDDQTKLNYYLTYLGFLEGERIQRMKDAGIEPVSVSLASLDPISKILKGRP